MIRFSRQHIEATKKHGERDYPHECCGLLIGMVLEQATSVSSRRIPSQMRVKKNTKEIAFSFDRKSCCAVRDMHKSVSWM
jgi:proteasome lid subunit RPN8/RPN11